jgi:hypothetical protein
MNHRTLTMTNLLNLTHTTIIARLSRVTMVERRSPPPEPSPIKGEGFTMSFLLGYLRDATLGALCGPRLLPPGKPALGGRPSGGRNDDGCRVSFIQGD